ncbi:hypothetical protein JCM5350_001762 [Sporobolomyces pararoseus]
MTRPPSASSRASSRPPTRLPSVQPSRSNSRSSRRSSRPQNEAPVPTPQTTTTTSEPPSQRKFYVSLFSALIFCCIPLLGAPSVCFYSRHLPNRHGGLAKEVIGGKGLILGAVVFMAYMIILALVQLPNKAQDGSFEWVGAISGESAPVALISMWVLGTFVAWSIVIEGMLSTPPPPRSIPLRNVRPASDATLPPYEAGLLPPAYPQRPPSSGSLPPDYNEESHDSSGLDSSRDLSSPEDHSSSGEDSDRRASRRLWGGRRSASTRSHRRRPVSVFSVPNRNSLPSDRQSI